MLIFNKFPNGFIGTKNVSTPLPRNGLEPYDGDINVKFIDEHSQIVGTILHLSRVNMQDLSSAAPYLGSFMHNPSQEHLYAAKHCISYMKTTADFKITYHGSTSIPRFSYSNENTLSSDGRSIGGYIFTMNNGAIFGAKKQTNVSLSSLVSEYFGLSDAATESQFLAN